MASRVTVSAAATGNIVTAVTDRHGIDAAAISPDDASSAIYLWNTATRQMTASYTHPGAGRTITRLAVPGGVQILRLAVSHGATTLTASYLTGHDGPRPPHWTISPQA